MGAMIPAHRASAREAPDAQTARAGIVETLQLARDLSAVIWQWPMHRVLWSKRLNKGMLVSVVAQLENGMLICYLGHDHHFVLWPEDVERPPATRP
ncbi:hypothetical protein MYX77_09625 [Acidobacteriia bacterium AH_259_A11_L15]|nr:hypothetical protein [Acidobacteriia bacterium AH_259_A11_L15]